MVDVKETLRKIRADALQTYARSIPVFLGRVERGLEARLQAEPGSPRLVALDYQDAPDGGGYVIAGLIAEEETVVLNNRFHTLEVSDQVLLALYRMLENRRIPVVDPTEFDTQFFAYRQQSR